MFGPWLFHRLQEEAYGTVRKVQRVYLLLYCVVTVGVLAISPEIVKIIGSKEYWDGTRIIMWVVFAAASTVIIYFAMLVSTDSS